MLAMVQLFEIETSEFVIYAECEGDVYSEERKKPKKANVTALHSVRHHGDAIPNC